MITTIMSSNESDVLTKLDAFLKTLSPFEPQVVDDEALALAESLGGPLFRQVYQLVHKWSEVIGHQTNSFVRCDENYYKHRDIDPLGKSDSFGLIGERQVQWFIRYNPQTKQVFLNNGQELQPIDNSLVEMMVGYIIGELTWHNYRPFEAYHVHNNLASHEQDWCAFWRCRYDAHDLTIYHHKTHPIVYFDGHDHGLAKDGAEFLLKDHI